MTTDLELVIQLLAFSYILLADCRLHMVAQLRQRAAVIACEPDMTNSAP
jgi:hypothetical protein